MNVVLPIKLCHSHKITATHDNLTMISLLYSSITRFTLCVAVILLKNSRNTSSGGWGVVVKGMKGRGGCFFPVYMFVDFIAFMVSSSVSFSRILLVNLFVISRSHFLLFFFFY